MGIRGAVRKAAKKAGRGAANKVRAGARKVGKQIPGYGEMEYDKNRNLKQNKGGKSLRRVTRGGK